MKRILITGANGFIGSFMVEEALKQGYEVHAGIRKTSNLQYLNDFPVHYVELDYTSPQSLERDLNKLKQSNIHFDYIIHNAGLTASQNSSGYFKVNYENTKHFIEALQTTGMAPEKFVYISSLASYGPGDPDSLIPVKTSDNPEPLTTYGKSKLKAERYIASLPDFPHIIIRPTAVYGPRDKGFYVFFKLIKNHFEPYMGLDNNQRLTFIYVKDLARVIVEAAASPHVNKSYFVSDGNVYSARTLGDLAKRTLNKKTIRLNVPVSVVKAITIPLERVTSIWGYRPLVNSEKIKELSSTNWSCDTEPLYTDLDFTAEYDLEKGVEETINWYREQEWL